MAMPFRLTKWYLDCVTSRGEVVVLYWASLRWGAVLLRYGAVVGGVQDVRYGTRHTMWPGHPPSLGPDGTLAWSCRRLAASGTWSRLAEAFRLPLLREGPGLIDLHCVCPRAEVVLELEGQRIEGLGYAEHLTTTIPPWRLPLQELSWGRFLSSRDVALWIEWKGPLPRRWFVVNGVIDTRPAISDQTLTTENGDTVLRIRDGPVLRTGRVTSALPVALRALLAVVPQWREIEETKWVAKGLLSGTKGSSEGWVIHEVVRWL